MKLGSLDISTVKLGSTQINSVYLGAQVVWTSALPVSPEAQAWINNIETNSGEVCDDDERQRVENIASGITGTINTADGSHTQLDMLFHPMKTAAKSLAYWNKPGTASLVGAPVFISGIGFLLNGIDQYINSGTTLNAAGNKYDRYDSVLGSYVYDAEASGVRNALYGAQTGYNCYLVVDNANSRWYRPVNTSVNRVASFDGNSWSALSSYASASPHGSIGYIYKNGVTISSDSFTSGGVPLGSLYFGSRAGVDLFKGTISGGYFGIDTAWDYVSWNTLMQANIGTF